MQKHYYYKIQLPTKAYLASYLKAIYGDPLVFRRDCFFGMTLVAYLEKDFSHRRNQNIKHKEFDDFKTQLVLHLPRSWMKQRQYGHDLSDKNVIYINKFFEERFCEDLVKYCHYRAFLGIDTKESIEAFSEFYNIEIDKDITFEGLKRKELRKRNKMNGALKTAPQPLKSKRGANLVKPVKDFATAEFQPLPFVQLPLL